MLRENLSFKSNHANTYICAMVTDYMNLQNSQVLSSQVQYFQLL